MNTFHAIRCTHKNIYTYRYSGIQQKRIYIAIGSATRVNINYLPEGHIVALIRTYCTIIIFIRHIRQKLSAEPPYMKIYHRRSILYIPRPKAI